MEVLVCEGDKIGTGDVERASERCANNERSQRRNERAWVPIATAGIGIGIETAELSCSGGRLWSGKPTLLVGWRITVAAAPATAARTLLGMPATAAAKACVAPARTVTACGRCDVAGGWEA